MNINERENDSQNRYIRISILDNDVCMMMKQYENPSIQNVKNEINTTQSQHDVSPLESLITDPNICMQKYFGYSGGSPNWIFCWGIWYPCACVCFIAHKILWYLFGHLTRKHFIPPPPNWTPPAIHTWLYGHGSKWFIALDKNNCIIHLFTRAVYFCVHSFETYQSNSWTYAERMCACVRPLSMTR